MAARPYRRPCVHRAHACFVPQREGLGRKRVDDPLGSFGNLGGRTGKGGAALFRRLSTSHDRARRAFRADDRLYTEPVCRAVARGGYRICRRVQRTRLFPHVSTVFGHEPHAVPQGVSHRAVVPIAFLHHAAHSRCGATMRVFHGKPIWPCISFDYGMHSFALSCEMAESG